MCACKLETAVLLIMPNWHNDSSLSESELFARRRTEFKDAVVMSRHMGVGAGAQSVKSLLRVYFLLSRPRWR